MPQTTYRTGCLVLLGCAVVALAVIGGCPATTTPNLAGSTGSGNTTDKTNANAKYIGSSACNQCHEQIYDWQRVHGHSHKLKRVQGGPPEYPAEGLRAGVPDTPEGFDWSNIAYVIGGYIKKARFIDQDGFILLTGIEGVDTQWNLDFPPNGTEAGFAPYEADRTTPKGYGFSCFVCHTTGAQDQDEAAPMFQENRPGFAGTWAEAGVQCESCHGPGSNHFTTVGSEVVIDRTAIFTDPTGEQSCNQCHNRPFDSQDGTILASGGYIRHHEQYPELMASGGHSAFTCITCHDPHRSVVYDRENAIRNACTTCHDQQNHAFHEGKVFVRGNHTEELSCESCHMAYATKSATTATSDIVGDAGRMGDTRSHIFRINTEPVDFTGMFSSDGDEVVRDSQGRAAVSVDFVCLRCHNGIGNAFSFDLETAAEIAIGMHGN